MSPSKGYKSDGDWLASKVKVCNHLPQIRSMEDSQTTSQACWDLHHMQPKILQFNGNSYQWPNSDNVHPRQIDNLSYPVQTQESSLFSPRHQKDIHPSPFQLPEKNEPSFSYFQASFFKEKRESTRDHGSSSELGVSESSNSPERSNQAQVDFASMLNRGCYPSFLADFNDSDSEIFPGENPNSPKRLPCFMNITNKAQVVSTAVSSKAGCPGHMDINPLRNLQYLNKKSLVYKTELCKKFQAGYCPYGDICQFAHGPNELRSIIRHPAYKSKLCQNMKYFGSCAYGQKCNFKHLTVTVTPSQIHNLGSDGEISP